MPEIRQAPVPSDPIRALVDGINAAVTAGINVTTGPDPGVVCISREGDRRWAKDPACAGVSPLGAAILARQPHVTLVDAAACCALGVGLPYIEGVCAGIAKRDRDVTWMASNARQLYLTAYNAGTLVRMAMLSLMCPQHLVRHDREKPCPECVAADARILRSITKEEG